MAQDAPTIIGSKAALPAFKEGTGAGIKKFILTSNETGKNVNITPGLMDFTYYESILQDVVRAHVSFVDTGDSVDGKSVMEGLPVYGTEHAAIEIEDNNKQVIAVDLYVNKPDDIMEDTRKQLTMLNFASKEFFDNEKVRVNVRFDGLISDSVESILTVRKAAKSSGGAGGNGGSGGAKDKEFLNTQKELFIEKTSNKRNFFGNNWKPFYTVNWLAKQAVPSDEENPEGSSNSAGFMFWETAEGFHFKSIDGLMNRETNPVKRRFIYNETSEGPCSGQMPEGYDAKILELTVDNRIDVQEKLKMGAYSTRTWLFDPYTTKVEILYPNAFLQGADSVVSESENQQGNQKYLKLAGEKFPYWNKELNKDIDFSRTEFRILDTGTLPAGKGSGKDNAQIKESKNENAKPKETLNQGNMRLNQLFASKVVVTIPGDFSLRAGDMVYIDLPGLRKKATGTDELNKQVGGYYIIGSICHYLDSSNTLTKMDLVRDSFGRQIQDRKSMATSGQSGKSGKKGVFSERRFNRRSSSDSAKANTNRFGQNIKTSLGGARGRWAAKNSR